MLLTIPMPSPESASEQNCLLADSPRHWSWVWTVHTWLRAIEPQATYGMGRGGAGGECVRWDRYGTSVDAPLLMSMQHRRGGRRKDRWPSREFSLVMMYQYIRTVLYDRERERTVPPDPEGPGCLPSYGGYVRVCSDWAGFWKGVWAKGYYGPREWR